MSDIDGDDRWHDCINATSDLGKFFSEDIITFYEKRFRVLGRSIMLQAYDSYERSPHWSPSLSIEIQIEREGFNDYVIDETIYLDSLADDNDEEESKRKWSLYPEKLREILRHIEEFVELGGEDFSPIESVDTIKYDLPNNYSDLFKEAFKLLPEKEKERRTKEIADHNARCEKLRAENPFWALKHMLAPGLSSIFGDGKKCTDKWSDIYEQYKQRD